MKLNQVIAIEKGEKARHCSEITKLHRMSGQPALFNGMKKVYERKDEAGETFPDESVLVQTNVKNVLKTVSASLVEVFDIEAAKDFGNMKAIADVVVAGHESMRVILKAAPATFLLFLEKQLLDIATFVDAFPVLDPAETWNEDKDSGLYKADPRKTHKTKKIQKSLTMIAPTKEHPGQAQLITEDEVVGYWITTKLSGAISATRKQIILDRVNTLIKAVKIAREAANNTDVERQNIGAEIVEYLFA